MCDGSKPCYSVLKASITAFTLASTRCTAAQPAAAPAARCDVLPCCTTAAAGVTGYSAYPAVKCTTLWSMPQPWLNNCGYHQQAVLLVHAATAMDITDTCCTAAARIACVNCHPSPCAVSCQAAMPPVPMHGWLSAVSSQYSGPCLQLSSRPRFTSSSTPMPVSCSRRQNKSPQQLCQSA